MSKSVFSPITTVLDELEMGDRAFALAISRYEQDASACFVGKSPRFLSEPTDALRVLIGLHVNHRDQRERLDLLQRDFVITLFRDQGFEEMEWRTHLGAQIEKIMKHLVEYISYTQDLQTGYLLSTDKLVSIGYAELHREPQGLLGLLRYSMLLAELRSRFMITADLRHKAIVEILKKHGEYCPHCLKKAACENATRPSKVFGLN